MKPMILAMLALLSTCALPGAVADVTVSSSPGGGYVRCSSSPSDVSVPAPVGVTACVILRRDQQSASVSWDVCTVGGQSVPCCPPEMSDQDCRNVGFV